MQRPNFRFSGRGYGAALLGALTLAGCTSYSPGMQGNANTEGVTTSAAKEALRGDNNFTSALGREYFALAGQRAGAKDWTDADYFARKSLAASKGEAVLPENNLDWLIAGQGAEKRRDAQLKTPDEMQLQRKRLVTALDGGGRDKYPALSAQVQARYDCWIEQSEASYRGRWQPSDRPAYGDCYRQYISAASDLEVLLHPPGPYHAYFDLNKKNLGTEASAVVKQAAVKIPQDGNARVKVIGWTDRSGSNAYNEKLAEERVEAVRNALVADGMARDRIDIVAKGETGVPVPTKDGVKEPKNRVVEVYAEVPPQIASGSSTSR